MGDCYKKLGQMQQAIECYTRAYELTGQEIYKK